MIHNLNSKKRRVLQLSATFLLVIVALFACKKVNTELGSSAYDPSELMAAGAIDTFTINSYTIIEDSINTRNPDFNLLGEINDPIFGRAKASFYTQIRLSSFDPNFGEASDIQIDSFVLAMKFADHTGGLTSQTFEVYRVTEEISSDTAVKFYEFSSLNTSATNLVMPGKGTFQPNPDAPTKVDTVFVDAQLRLSLDTNLARDLINEASNSGSSVFSSIENFNAYFNGLKITTNNTPLAQGKGAVYSLDMVSSVSKLTIYYKEMESVDGVMTPVRHEYDFVINSNCQSFNHIDFDRAGSKLASYAGDKTKGNTEFYTQTFGTRAVIEIPGLSNLPAKAVIHKAIFDLPFQYQTGSIYNPGSSVNLSIRENADFKQSTPLGSVKLSDFTKSLNFDLRDHVQRIVSGGRDNQPIYIIPSRTVHSMDRIIFNGRNTNNKVKPKIYIIYTEF